MDLEAGSCAEVCLGSVRAGDQYRSVDSNNHCQSYQEIGKYFQCLEFLFALFSDKPQITRCHVITCKSFSILVIKSVCCCS